MTDGRGRFLKEMYERYGGELNRYLWGVVRGKKEDAEDISQSAFMKLAAQSDLGKINDPRAYLYQTARNLVVDLSRKRSRDVRLNESFADEKGDLQETITPERLALCREKLKVVENIILGLPPKQRRVFILSRILHMSYAEIAEETGLSIAGVKQHVVRALATCRLGLAHHLPEGGGDFKMDHEKQ